MKILEHYSLKAYHTFGIEVDARAFAGVASANEIIEAVDWANKRGFPWMILGGGSNILFTQAFPGLVIHMDIKGIEVKKETPDKVIVKVGAGEVWDEWVAWAVSHGYGGLENLSLIPGSVGASPVQNIGAYGVELKDHFHSLEFLEFDTGKIHIFSSSQCNFGYRNSIFKQELKGKGAVISVSFCLSKKPKINSSYGTIQDELKSMGVVRSAITDVRQAVIQIRERKLPDPKLLGNAGSFFKNPVIDQDVFRILQQRFPNVAYFQQADGRIKLAAGWLIDRCGLKGLRKDTCGVHDKQALVIVNHGGASGKDILSLSEEIQASVFSKFEIQLEREVNVI